MSLFYTILSLLGMIYIGYHIVNFMWTIATVIDGLNHRSLTVNQEYISLSKGVSVWTIFKPSYWAGLSLRRFLDLFVLYVVSLLSIGMAPAILLVFMGYINLNHKERVKYKESFFTNTETTDSIRPYINVLPNRIFDTNYQELIAKLVSIPSAEVILIANSSDTEVVNNVPNALVHKWLKGMVIKNENYKAVILTPIGLKKDDAINIKYSIIHSKS